ncbi:MAG TPA: YjbQ family protein [Firmicutes bacterium]|nr:YjbQ family protein [Bacillota bacterium]
MITINVKTGRRIEFIDITQKINNAIREYGWSSGILTVYCPHTTAAITINENADPSVQSDINSVLSKLIPHRGDYSHTEGNADAHVKSSLIGPSEQVILHAGEMILGTWQGIFFCEFDGPRDRRVHLHFRSD